MATNTKNTKENEAVSPADLTPQEQAKMESPRWPIGFKLLIASVLIVGFFILFFSFREYVSLVLVSFLFAFLLKPLIRFLNTKLNLSWGLSVTIVYILFLLLIIGIIFGGGSFLISQGQNIFNIIKQNLGGLSEIIDRLQGQPIYVGPLRFQLPAFNTDEFSQDLLGRLQPLVGSAGTAVTKTVGFVGSTIFKLLIVYVLSIFLVGDGKTKSQPSNAVLQTGYAYDLERFSLELNRIWNAFIRGQFSVIAITVVIYSIVLGVLGFQYFISLALVAGLGRLIPYLGAWVTWITFGAAAITLNPTPFGMQPWAYTVMVLVIALLIDQLIDNGIQPRIMGNALSVHPAAIMISALVSAQLFGLLGLILNAPILATIKLIGNYVFKKLMDQDPWEGIEYIDKTKSKSFRRFNKMTSGLTKGLFYTVNSLKNWVKRWLKLED